MKVEQLFTGCIAEMAYYIEDNGEVAIIDPLRETEPYLKMAEKDGAKIKWIFVTHFHADFVSGQVDLAKKTGATIVFGPGAEAEYDIHDTKDGEIFNVGNIKLELLHTPGHTMESMSLVLIDEDGNKPYIFSGDALFIGDVGRPDLAVKSGSITEADLAGMLFDSLRNKIMPLPDDIIVYPNHGAGSACGKNMSSETFDTLGNQKATNYALRADMTKEEFIVEVTTGLKTPPQYFPNNARMNKSINISIDEVLERGTKALSASEFKELASKSDILVLDTRSKDNYSAQGTVPGAWWIGICGSFAPWVGALITNIDQKIIFICDEDSQAQEVVTRLSRVGYDNAAGFLAGGIKAWTAAGNELATIGSTSAEEFATNFKAGNCEAPLDVRKETEFMSEHIVGIENFSLDFINKNIGNLDKNKDYFVHCASGYRSLVAASIMRANGITKVTDIRGGYKDLAETSLEKTEFVCPTTML